MTAREEVLERENKELRVSLEQSEQERKKLEKRNEDLLQRINELSRRLFGRSSEKLDKNQLEFLFDYLKAAEKPPPPEPENPEDGKPGDGRGRKRRKAKIKTPPNIEVVNEIILPEPVRANPDQWREIDRVVLEQLDYIPAKFIQRVTIRPKFVHIYDRTIAPIIAPAPPRVIDRGGAAPGLLAHLLGSKYIDHLPCYRLAKIFLERHQVEIARQQINQWIGHGCDQLELIHGLIKDDVLEANYKQIDETPIRFLDKEKPKGSALGYLWTYLAPGVGVVFDWQTRRSTEALREFLGNSFSGKVQCDGYRVYDIYAAENPGVELIGCWAHARRKFEYAQNQDLAIATEVLDEIRKLYSIDRELRHSRAGPEERFQVRKERSVPIAERLHERLLELATQLRPSSGLGAAVSYTLGQWRKLWAVFEHGEAELDTNLVENEIRPSAIGKKNWLFIGHRDAGKRAAILYTIIETCRIYGVEPYAYLKETLERLPSATNQTVHLLTPRAWAEAQAAKAAEDR